MKARFVVSLVLPGLQIDTDASILPAPSEHGTIEDKASTPGVLSALVTSVAQESEPEDMDKSRRRLLQYTPHLIGGTLVSSSTSNLLDTSLLERLSRALAKPSNMDEVTLEYLEHRTDSYWGDHYSVALASCDLLSYVVEHLQKVTVLLEGSLLPATRTRLCSISGETALLVGALLYDIRNYAAARSFCMVAIKAAQEANNPMLEAVAWGWMSFTWTHDDHPQKALSCIQQATRLTIGNVSPIVRSWLAAVEAEIRANLGEFGACLKAFDVAEHVGDQQTSEASDWIRFDSSLLAGYKGVCFRRLYRPEDKRTHPFLDDAQKALLDALTRLDPTLILRKPTYYLDLAATYIPQEEIEQACKYAHKAVAILAQIKSQTILQRLLLLRQDLEMWKDTLEVKNLDEHMASLLLSRG